MRLSLATSPVSQWRPPRISRVDADTSVRVASHLVSGSAGTIAEGVGRLLGRPVSLSRARLEWAPAVPRTWAGVQITTPRWSAIVLVEPTVAMAVARAALRVPDFPRGPFRRGEEGALLLLAAGLTLDAPASVGRCHLADALRADRSPVIEAELAIGEVTGRVQLRLLEGMPPWSTSTAPTLPPDLLGAPATLRYQIGRCVLRPSDLSRWRGGDVLLWGPRAARLGGIQGGFPCESNGDALRITGPYHCGGISMEDNDGTSALDEAQVTVTIELARATVPVREVLSLVVGSIVRLERPPSTVADVCIDGRVVARGEVVEVDGELGVRLREIVSPAQAHG